MSNSEDKKRAPAGLDLGLSALIQSANSNAEDAPSVKESATRTVVAPATISAAEEESEFKLMADKGLWKDLSAYCERFMTGERFSPVIKLWWILSQLRLKSAPLNILSAPLESASEEVLSSATYSSSERSLATQLLIEVARGARDSKEYAVSLAFLEKAYAHDLSAKDDLMHVVALEKDRLTSEARVRKIDGLEAKLAKLEALSQRLGIGVDSARDPAVSIPASTPESILQISRTAKRSSNIVPVVVVALLIFFGGAWYARERYLASFETYVAKDAVLDPASDTKFLAVASLPEIPRRSGLGELDAVFYELGAKGQRTSTVVSTPKPIASVVLAEPKKEKIDTEQPVRSKEVEILPEEPKRADELFEKPSRRVRERPRRKLPVGDVAPIEIVNFDGEREYMVEADTEILSKPSWGSVPVDNVYEGDRVRAEAKVGNWLKLRSAGGRIGYVSMDYVHERDAK